MAELVGEGLDGLGVVHVGTNRDNPVVEPGVSVPRAAVAALDGEPVGACQRGEPVPELVGCRAAQPLGRDVG